MRTLPVVIGLLCASALCAAVQWAPAPENYKLLPGGAIAISDGGQSQPDRYLLSAQDLKDFILDFEAIMSPAGGEKVRAIVVWAVDDADRANRKAFFLPTDRLTPGKRYHFRVTVAGERAVLRMDGAIIGTTATLYGTPPATGRVGFLHYYNHNFRYENVTLAPLEAASLPAPLKPTVGIERGGLCRISWQVPEVYEGLLTYRVYRAVGAPPKLEAKALVGTTAETVFRDRSLRSHTLYHYAVVPVSGETGGTKVARLTVKTGMLPPPAAPAKLTATRRLNGEVRVRWALADDSRVQTLSLYRAATAAEAAGGGQLVANGVRPEMGSYLAPVARGDWYALAILSPDGGPAQRTVAQALPSAPQVSATGGVPTKHPYLQYNPTQIERAKQTLAAGEEGQKLARSLRASADGYTAKPAAVPEGVNDDMSALTNRLQTVGLYYQLLGDEKYAQWVHDAILGYAKLYPTLPDRQKRVKLSKTVSGLYEAVWYVPLILAYDLVYDSGCFTPAEHQQIERDLLRPAAELFWVRDYNDPKDYRPGDLHYKCYNFQAWFISAVGLTGLMLKDADMVEHALDGPYGLKHLLAHDVHDDGMFWERSAGYHSFVISALFPLLQGAYHCNLDLYKLEVPDDYNTDREPLLNYCVGDGDNGPKSMKLMFDGPFYYTFPDYTWPVVADSSRGPLSVNAPYRAAWEHYRDPKYAWLINRNPTPAIPKVTEGDAAGTVRLSLDGQTLKLSAAITDQVVRNSHEKPDQVWQGDLLWVGLKWREEKGGPYDIIYGLSPGESGKVPPVAVIFDRFGRTVGEVSAAQYAVSRTAQGYTIAAAIPLAELAPKAGEKGTAFAPGQQQLTADFVIYDCDAKTGETTKEKMVSWSCKTDRYDSSQGREVVLGTTVAEIGAGATVMTDASSGGLNLDDLLYERPVETGSFALTDGKFCNNGVVANGCSLFPSTGFSLLRGTPFSVNLTYGPYGGGHGHPDKLSLVVFADGKHLLPDFGSCKYESTEKAQWTSHTISHNTLTVDGLSQKPAGEVDHGFLADSFEEKSWGKLDFFHTTPTIKVVQAHVEGLFPGVKLTRTVALVGDKLIDIYRVDSKEKHVYDYALHVDAPLVQASVALGPLADPLGSKCGYQHLHKAQGSAATSETITTQWGSGDAAYAIAAAGGEPTQLLTAESITNALDKFMPMLILRREATSTRFVTALAKGARAECQVSREGTIGVNGSEATLFISPTPDRPVAIVSEESFTGQVRATRSRGDESEAAYFDFRELRRERDTIRTDRPCDLTIRRIMAKQWLVMGPTAAQVTYQVRGRKAVVIDAKPGQTYQLPEAN